MPTARRHLKAILPEASEEDILSAVPLQGAKETLEWLSSQYGIAVNAAGTIAKEHEPKWNLDEDFKPMRGLTGLLTRAVQEKQYADLVRRHAAAAATEEEQAHGLRREAPADAQEHRARAAAHLRHAVRLRSAAGAGIHDWVEICPKHSTLQLDDKEFTFAVRWRLGLPVMRQGQCQLQSSKDIEQNRRCCKQCDKWGDHAVLRGKDRGHYRAHNSLCHCICRFARQSGVEAEVEETCPELAQGTPGTDEFLEARLDIHLWGSGDGLYEEWVDVTVTHPWKQSSRKAASSKDGAAAEQAEARKRSRYAEGVGGTQCAPAGSETWGRLGASALQVLDRLACQNACRTWAPQARTLKRWRAELGIALNRALAASIAQAGRLHRENSEQHEEIEDGDSEVDAVRLSGLRV